MANGANHSSDEELFSDLEEILGMADLELGTEDNNLDLNLGSSGLSGGESSDGEVIDLNAVLGISEDEFEDILAEFNINESAIKVEAGEGMNQV